MSLSENGASKGIPKFDCHSEPATLGPRWTRWFTSFELFADGKGLIITEGTNATTRQRRRAMLLHLAGQDVQEIFSTLANTGEATDYTAAVTALNGYFLPKVNSAFARQKFHRLQQQPGETVLQFVTRLRKEGKDYNFGADFDNQIRDAILCKCRSDYVKRKLLEERDELTLARTLELAEQCESVEHQMSQLSLSEQTTEAHRVYEKPRRPKDQQRNKESKNRDSQCPRCGWSGHLGGDPKCPARGQTCKKCKKKGHFASVCKTKPKKPGVNQVQEEQKPDGEQVDYAFRVTNKGQSNMLKLSVGGVELEMLVDSGATNNIIDECTWEDLKAKKIKCKSQAAPVDRKLYAYASSKPLPVKGSFTCEVLVGRGRVQTEFLVIKGKGIPLLSKDTAMRLGVLKIGVDIATIAEGKQTLQQKFPEVFSGIGKLKSKQVTLHIDETVKPVAQPLRRIPFNLQEKVEKKVQELLNCDIIEEVDGPTPWVNPVVIIPKADGDIRLCIDMRQANKAIVRGRYPIPTVDELLHNMNGSKVFSKLDLKWGYHQLELNSESRQITTFVTHKGLYRYKRLLFGVCSASEQYQHEISTALAGIEGVDNISDDIIVHGPDQATHDQRLYKTMERLKQHGLTLNADKCLFNVDRVIFMGILLSEKGIGPTEERIRALQETREPATVSEVRSFLGLANYSSRFIPHFATITEPLRSLTRKAVPFHFGPEQKTAFKILKQSMADAGTLAYFNKGAATKVIADASPVGLGAVLLQNQNEAWVPICYASRSLTECERKYSQTEKEALALVWACERYHAYIYGMKFDLVTDHKPLEVIYGPRSKPCARVERWTIRLQPYDFRIVYTPGQNNIADPLSRLLKQDKVTSHPHGAEEYIRFAAISATPQALTTREVEEASATDEELKVLREAIKTGRFEKCKNYAPAAGELCVIGQLVLRGTRIVLPNKLRAQAISLAHEGHLGIVGTKQNLRSKVWWPRMDKAAEKFCKSCHGCQLVSRPDPPEPLRSTTLPEGPWQDLAIDLLGPLPSGHSIIVVVDYYSRYYEYAIMMSTVTEKVIDNLEEIFSRHGLPLTIKSDNGPQFRSEEFREYCKQNGIVHTKTTPKWPQANGEVERQNASLMKRIRIAQAEGLDWVKELRRYVTKYRGIDHATTGKSPAELLFNRKMRGKLPELHADHHLDLETRDRDAEVKAKTKVIADKSMNAKPSEVQVGDQVLVRQEKRDKFSTPFNPVPFQVVSKTGNSVVVETPGGTQYSRNTSHVKKFVSPDNPEEPPVSVDVPTTPEITVVPNQVMSGSTPVVPTTPPSRPLTHLTPLAQASAGSKSGTTSASKNAAVDQATVPSPPATPKGGRSQRQRRLPGRYKDFVLKC
nr:uncharacterized protein K02A2.6-like [Pocillopora verrucosa]